MENSIDLLDEFDSIKINRRRLLPWWIKVFCWLFMAFGVAAIFSLALGIWPYAKIFLYGFETNEPLSLLGLLIISVAIFKAVTAFSLWFEKDYAITLGKVDAIGGIALCTISMVVLPFILHSYHVTIRLELALLIPYFVKLNKIKTDWRQ